MDDADPTKAPNVADPTEASNVAEDETESIHAWSQSDDADTEFVDHRGSRARWITVVSALVAAVAAVSASLFLWHQNHGATRQSAPTPTPRRQTAPAPIPTPRRQTAPAPSATAPPSVSINPGWPVAWQNAARAYEQVPPPPGMCYADDGSPFTWENFIGPAVNCTPPPGLTTGGFLPLPPHDRGVLPTGPYRDGAGQYHDGD
jgi:hypothetical protein